MKIHLAVLFGGRSVEHEVSVISALQAIRSLDAGKYEVFPIYITKRGEFYYGKSLTDIENYRDIPALLKQCAAVNFESDGTKTYLIPKKQKIFGKTKPIALIDVAFPIVHGTNVEDGKLQGYLGSLNLPFVGCDVLSSAVCMDKYVSKSLLKDAGIPVLDCLRFTAEDNKQPAGIVKTTEDKFTYPVIVKPVNLGSSVGISKAKDSAELSEAVSLAFSFAEVIIIEPAVMNLKEINCSVAGDTEEAEASECEEPVASDEILSYKDKYLDGGKNGGSKSGSKGMASLKRRIPADITSEMKTEIQDTAVKAFKHLGCNGVVRVDFLTDTVTNEIWLNEINTIPGSLSFYLWEPTGLKYPALIDRLISLALKRERKAEDIVYSFDTNILASGKSFGAKGSKR
ncbi:D-alanine--D-alanine ligase [Clostridia bacterium]|nr:D-alanine--D-alanine ligase [Clostridia bacterium]GHU34550.1 D-alanine--D-alanine ligase [Clostridia bacterium]